MTDDAAVQSLLDIEAIKVLRSRYTRSIDTKDWDLFRDCLSENSRLVTEGGVQEGRDTIVAGISAALATPITVHHVHQPEIVLTGPDSATGVWAMNDIVEFQRDGKPVFFLRGCGHYTDGYIRTGDGWKISSSTLSRLRVDTEGEYPGA
jgi:hypothetical protein